MIVLPIGVPYRMVTGVIYALPSKAVLAGSNASLEISMDGVQFFTVTLTNQAAALAATYVRTIWDGTIVNLKELGLSVVVPGGGNEGGGLPEGEEGTVLIGGSNPEFSPQPEIESLILINPAGDPGLRRWEIKVVGTDLAFDSQNDSGVSYNRPLRISLFNGGIQAHGAVVSNASMSCNLIGITEVTFSSIVAGQSVGSLANISDSTVNTVGATVAGGGAFHVLARFNGTIWKVVGV